MGGFGSDSARSGEVADAMTLATALALPALCNLLIAAYGWSARTPV